MEGVPTGPRAQLWDILQFGKGKLGRIFTATLVILIILSLAILLLELLGGLEKGMGVTISTLEVGITAFFTIEYVLRIYAAPRRLHYLFSFFGIIDFLSIAPFYLGLLGTPYLRTLRLARLLRILKVSRIEATSGDELSPALNLLEGERIEHIVTKHPIFFLVSLIPSLLSLIASLGTLLIFGTHPIVLSLTTTLILFAALFLYKAWLDYHYDVIYVTSHRLIFQNWHLLGRDINQISYRAITNVKPKYTNIWGYLLGFGSLTIETAAADTGTIEHRLVRSHEHSAHTIMRKAVEAKHGPTSSP